MELNSTYYPNVTRTIVGLGNIVFPNDVMLVCDTTLNAVDILLADIPSGAWNTTYKLYVQDSGNASVNNITIIAPVGYTINGQPTLVINTNDTTAIIRISNNKSYLAVLTLSGGGSVSVINEQNPLTPAVTLTTALDKLIVKGLKTSNIGNDVTLENAFIVVTNAQIQFLKGNNLLIPNQWYNVTDAQYGNLNNSTNIYIPALTENSTSTLGIGEFYDADYQGFGSYTAISGFAGQLGIWNTSLITPINSVVIWNNLHYVNINGLNGLFPPPSDPDAWVLLPYSVKNGYILAYDEVTYGFKNRIYYRKDKFNNAVEFHNDLSGNNSFDKFPFGNQLYKSNKVLNSSIWDCCNTRVSTRVYDNILNFTELLWTTLEFIGECSSNNFLGTLRPLVWRTGNTALEIIKNNFSYCQGISTLEDCVIQQNNIINSSFALTISGNSNINNNNLISSQMIFTKTHGLFAKNNLSFSIWTMSNSDGLEQDNIVSNGIISIGNNSGVFKFNNVSQNSSVRITNMASTGLFNFNTINFQSTISFDTISDNFGDSGVKGVGNTFSDCNFNVADFTGDCAGNNLRKVQLQIMNFNGGIGRCDFQGEASINIDDMQNHTFVELTAKEFIYGSVGYLMPESYTGGVYTFGLANIKCTLDCSDPLIYNSDPSQFSLTIPNELRKWGGRFTLINASGINIKKILNTYDKAPYTFFNDAGSTNFITTAVAGVLGGELIYTLPAPVTLSIVYRLDGSDYIVTNRSGNAMAITETAIFV